MSGILIKEAVALAALALIAAVMAAAGRRGRASAPGAPISQSAAAKKGAAGKAALSWPSQVMFAVKVALIMAFAAVPVFFYSDLSFSFYTPKDASLKVAFKHSGKRVVNCDEAEVIKSEGERYRQRLKEKSSVKMNMMKFSSCPRERHPVVVRLAVDGRELLNRAYAPTGLKKDLSSYISEEFLLTPGVHRVYASVSDSGNVQAPEYVLEETIDLKPAEVKLIMIEDRLSKLVVE